MTNNVDGAPIRVGLVLGAGGPTGGPFIHAALRELRTRTQWSASAASTIIGTSAGAFVAASVDAAAQETSAVELSSLSALQNGASFEAKLHHRVAAGVRRGVGWSIARLTPTSRPLAAYSVPAGPYHDGASVVTVQRRTSRRVVHHLRTVDDAELAVRASAAIPGVNKPIEIDGELHVDGAVHSAANVDVLDVDQHDALVVIAPMIAASGGNVVTRTHRAQLRSHVAPWIRRGKPTIIIVPDEVEHADRRNRDAFTRAGGEAVKRLG